MTRYGGTAPLPPAEGGLSLAFGQTSPRLDLIVNIYAAKRT